MDYKAYVLLGILLASLAAVSASSAAFAQAAAITVSTDKASYNSGETVTISGKVGTVVSGQSVILQVFNPKGAAYRFDVVSVAADGSYTYPLKIGGHIGITGTYTATVTYNKQQASSTFTFTAAMGNITGWQTAQVTLGGQSYIIKYMITGGSLTSLAGDPQTTSLKANISSTSPCPTTTSCMLTLDIPRNVMDSKDNATGKDSEYVVFVDSIQQTINETTTGTTDRTIQIPFEQGTQSVEVVGTFMIPEFGSVAVIILAIAVVGIIVATTKYTNKFSFLTRF